MLPNASMIRASFRASFRATFLATLALRALVAAPAAAAVKQDAWCTDSLNANRPNIVLFVADDLGWADLPVFADTRAEGHALWHADGSPPAECGTQAQPTSICTDEVQPRCGELRCSNTNQTCTTSAGCTVGCQTGECAPVTANCCHDCAAAATLDPLRQCPQCLAPSLDTLAASGARFDHFYTTAALCSPSRATIVTGRYGKRTGATGNNSVATLRGEELTVAEWLTRGCATPETTDGACYTTGLMGKWGNGWGNTTAPWRQGFDEVVGFLRAEDSAFRATYDCYPPTADLPPGERVRLLRGPEANPTSGPALLRLDPALDHDVCGPPLRKNGGGTLAIPAATGCTGTCGGSQSPNALQCTGDDGVSGPCPFYGCIGTCAGTTDACLTDGNCGAGGTCVGRDTCTGSTDAGDPLAASVVPADARYTTWVQRDLAISFMRRHHGEPCPFFLMVPLRAPHSPEQAPLAAARFAKDGGKYVDRKKRGLWATIQDVDKLVGTVVDEIERLEGLGGRTTLVLFTSDNGKAHDNLVVGGSKKSLLEGGVRLGLVARWPGRIDPGTVVEDRIGMTTDLLPTLADAAGDPLPTGTINQESCPLTVTNDDGTVPVDGRSLLPILEQGDVAADVHDFVFYSLYGKAVRSRQGFYDEAPYGSGYAGSACAEAPCTPCHAGCTCAPAALQPRERPARGARLSPREHLRRRSCPRILHRRRRGPLPAARLLDAPRDALRRPALCGRERVP
jgi:arylsulfatase A-like enzyme